MMNFFQWMEENGKGEMTWQELADKFGYKTGNVTKGLWSRHQDAKKMGKSFTPKGNAGSRIEAATAEYIGQLEEMVDTFINRESGTAKSTFNSTSDALSDEEIYKQCKMDPNKWVLTQVWQKSRQTGFNYSANFKLIPQNAPEKIEDAFANILKTYTNKYKPVSLQDLRINKNYSKPTCCFIALTDVHLDKQTIDGQSIEQKVDQYHSVLDTLLFKAYTSNNVEEIVFTIGHDLFNTDTFYNTTTNGTQQYPNTEWDKSYEVVFDSQVKAINKLKQFCTTLYIKYIPSNHARTKEYFLVHALSIYFASDKNIVFDRSAESSKVHLFGENFIGIHHGDVKSLEKLVPYFSQKYYKEWGQGKYKSIMVGDKHTRKSWNTTSTEVDGVRVYQTPHMGGYGQWDKSMMFENGIQSGIAMIFDKARGRIMEIEEIL